jgi:hypothetical protein
LSTHLYLGLPSGLFPSGFPTSIQNLYSYLSLLISSFCVVYLTTLSISQTIWLVINILKRIWKEAVVAWSRYYAGICLDWLETIAKILSKANKCSGRDSNRAPLPTHQPARFRTSEVSFLRSSIG